MRNNLARFACSILAIALTAFGSGVVYAQVYPKKPIKMIVPFPPGGPTDVQARIIAQMLGVQLGQAVVVENRGGAGGMIGSRMVAKSDPDGYTLLMGASGPQALGPLMAKESPYDPVHDFTALSLVSYSPLMLVVNPKLKATSVKDVIALAKERPGALNYGSFGVGTMSHLAGELFNTMAGVKIVHVPYTGSAPAITALLGGQIDLMLDTVITSLPQVKSGRLRGIAVTKDTRSSAAPDLPTVAETLPGFVAVSWIGLMGPAGLPKDVVDRLSSEMVKLLHDPAVRERLQAAGAEPVGSDAAAFATFVKGEVARWEPVVKAAGLLHSQ
jgi:tripartite-type tricarboxylate transporter receptor subunit TctC